MRKPGGSAAFAPIVPPGTTCGIRREVFCGVIPSKPLESRGKLFKLENSQVVLQTAWPNEQRQREKLLVLLRRRDDRPWGSAALQRSGDPISLS
jgi:hypothetical protein